MDRQQEEQTKREIARAALEELTKPSPTQKEPTVWERMQEEEARQKELKEEQKKAQGQQVALPSSGARKVPGLKSARKAKQQGSEQSKNIKSE